MWDKIGNHADLTHEAVPTDEGHRVDAPDMTGPAVTSISVSSDPGEAGAYAIGDAIEVTVEFNEQIVVAGTPQLELDIGGATGIAEFDSSDGSIAILSYVVAEGVESPEGVAAVADSLSLNGGSIQDPAGNVAELFHEEMVADEGAPVDGVRPAFASAEVSEDGTEVAVTFTEEVTISPMLLAIGEALEIPAGDFIRAFVLLSVDGQKVIATGASLSGDTLTLVLPAPTWEGQEIEVTFDDIFEAEGTPIFMDGVGNSMAGFASATVANLSLGLEIEYSLEATPDVVLSDTLIDLEEGESYTYAAALSMKPSDEVSVVITRTPLSRGPHAPLALPFLTMYFTPENWDVPQDVTIEAEADEDVHDHVILTHTAYGGGYHLEGGEIRVVIRDID